mmetsp:Transcript_13772/g.58881  ORF Transcript_13772/g.58881 Transcript_13772/m.58881 type:complete len:233 (+) Transcript_13772:3588-4286(+)
MSRKRSRASLESLSCVFTCARWRASARDGALRGGRFFPHVRAVHQCLFAAFPCMMPIRMDAAASATAPGPEGTKMVELLPCVPMSFMVSKYCVIIIISMTSFELTSPISCWKCITDSRRPLMIAWRWRAMPVPAKNFASASASAAFTTMIFSASALSCAATRKRCAALISFIALFTFESGAMSVTSVWMMAYPNSVIAFSNMDFTSSAISSLVVKTSSKMMRGTVLRTTSKM